MDDLCAFKIKRKFQFHIDDFFKNRLLFKYTFYCSTENMMPLFYHNLMGFFTLNLLSSDYLYNLRPIKG